MELKSRRHRRPNWELDKQGKRQYSVDKTYKPAKQNRYNLSCSDPESFVKGASIQL